MTHRAYLRFRLLDPHTMTELRRRYPSAAPVKLRATWLLPIVYLFMLTAIVVSLACGLVAMFTSTIVWIMASVTPFMVALLCALAFPFLLMPARALERQRRRMVLARRYFLPREHPLGHLTLPERTLGHISNHRMS